MSDLHGSPAGPGRTRPRHTDLLGEVLGSLLQVGGGLGPPQGCWLWDPRTSVQEKAAGSGVCPLPGCLEGGRETGSVGGRGAGEPGGLPANQPQLDGLSILGSVVSNTLLQGGVRSLENLPELTFPSLFPQHGGQEGA